MTALILFLKLLAVFFLVLLNGFFVAAEFAIVKIRDTQLRPLANRGNRKAASAQAILERLDSFLSVTQLGITLASLGLGWIGEPVFTSILAPLLNLLGIHNDHLRHSIAFIVGFSAITFFHIVAGEQAPKMLSIQKPLSTSLF